MRLSRRAVVLLTAALLGPALPSFATTSATSVVAPAIRSTVLELGATTAALTDRDELVGVTWASGSPQVRVRFLTPRGWTDFETPADDSDVPVAEERARARAGTEPVWRPTGATLVDVRVSGRATDLRLVTVGDGERRTSRSFGLADADAASGSALLGGVRSREDWGADESLRSGKVSYASGVQAVVVHHTAGGNDYSPQDVPRRIRADYAYHVKARGWSDLGYNLVVDKYGGIWEGRAGGIGRAVIGSHAAGFNTGTLGVSLLGDMTKAAPTKETVTALARVAAYAGATWRFDPTTEVTLTSKGSPRYRSGTRVTLGRVQGHTDTGRTSCPGALYDRLGDVRTGAKALLGPAVRITDVEVTGAPVHAPTPMIVRAELSRPAAWAVEVRDAGGAVVARQTGEGRTPHLEWNGLRADLAGAVPAQPGDYTWHVRADDRWHPVATRDGVVRVGLPVVPL